MKYHVIRRKNQDSEWIGDAVLTTYLRIFFRRDFPKVPFSTLQSVISYISTNQNLTDFCKKYDVAMTANEVESKLGALFLEDASKAQEYAGLIYRESKAPFDLLKEVNAFSGAGEKGKRKASQYKVLVAIREIGERGVINVMGKKSGKEIWEQNNPDSTK